MSKMSIADAAIKLSISKEAIHNRIRRGSLQSVVEDGVKLVILTPDTQTTNKQAPRATKTNNPKHHNDNRYYKFLEEQNEKLQSKVEKLEGETRTLRDQKEDMLVNERLRIEQIYKDKDEQLKNILNSISSNFLLNLPDSSKTIEQQEHLEAEIEVEENQKITLISLKKWLKKSDFSNKKCQKIKDRFNKIAKDDSRIVKVGKKLYIDPTNYDYSDLL